MEEDIAVFTRKAISELLRAGGTGDWVADRARVEKCRYVICTRNSDGAPDDGVAHGEAFLIGRGLSASQPDNDGRIVIGFREYAEVSVPDLWRGNRNPVAYFPAAGQFLRGLDVASLDWKPFPYDKVTPRPLTIAQAKAGLAVGLGVPEERIEIVIRA